VTQDLNPQAREMADESMVRNLEAQALAIWPQEVAIFRRHAPPPSAHILDAGCGTGEASARLAEEFPGSTVLGVDVLDAHLERARERTRHLGNRVRFENRTLFGLGLPPASFDLTVCRHVLQAIPHAERAIAELVRVTRPGGRVHLIAEDYGMVFFPPSPLGAAAFWKEVPERYGRALGIDLFIGRRAPAILAGLGLASVAVDYVVVDVLRVRREVFAAIWKAWRDGYAATVAEHCGMTAAEVTAHFDEQIAILRDPTSYAAWLVPVVSGIVPA